MLLKTNNSLIYFTIKSKLPYDFIIDYLPDEIIIRQLFGMHYIYFRQKNILILRDAAKEKELNGIWIATAQAHHTSLHADLPGVMAIKAEEPGKKDFSWIYIPSMSDHFEATAIRLCELIAHHDPRIGIVTKKSLSL